MDNHFTTDQYYAYWVLLEQTYHTLFQAREQELRSIGISTIKAAVLSVIKTIDGPATPTEISRWIRREPHSVSELLNRMVKKGLIKKIKDMKKKNQVRIDMTEQGEDIYQKLRDLKSFRDIISCLSSDEQENLWEYLRAVRNEAVKYMELKKQLPYFNEEA